jgi:transcriptional regulator with XRE-family HTH domain
LIDPKVFKSCRLRLEMTQAELATALGYSRVTVNMWEQGKARKGIPDHIAEKLLALGNAKVIEAATKLDQVVQKTQTVIPLPKIEGVSVFVGDPETGLWENMDEEDET